MKRRLLPVLLLAVMSMVSGARWLAAVEPVIDKVDFIEADLRDVFRSIGMSVGITVLLTKDVAGTLTLYIRQPMAVRQALERIAYTYGFSLRWLDKEKTVVVIGKAETLQQNFNVDLGETKIFVLRYSSVNEIAEALKVVVQPSKISLNPRTNQVVVTGSLLQLENAAEIIAQMDHPMPSQHRGAHGGDPREQHGESGFGLEQELHP